MRLVPLPRINKYINLTVIQRMIELATVLILYHNLALTEVNPPSEQSKLNIGWSILVVSEINFLLSKANLALQQYLIQKKYIKLPNYKSWACCSRTLSKEERFFNMSRQDLVMSYQMKLKNRYRDPKQPIDEFVTAQRVAPEQIFRDPKPKRPEDRTVFELRKKRYL